MTKREFFDEFQKLAWKCYKRELPGVEDAHISVYGKNGEPVASFFAYSIAATDKVAAKVGKKYLHEISSNTIGSQRNTMRQLRRILTKECARLSNSARMRRMNRQRMISNCEPGYFRATSARAGRKSCPFFLFFRKSCYLCDVRNRADG